MADILNTATWDNGPSQGFAFRVGGSYLYPVLPRNAYQTEAEWLAAQGDYSHIDRGRMAECFATFSMAREDDWRSWKQVFTDRCIELGAWTHMVATWDGEDMRLFLDGIEATDPWRIDGKGKVPLLDSVVDAWVGARNAGAFDVRPFDGMLDFVKVEDKALSPEEIRQRFKDTFITGTRDSLCMGVIIPRYPEAGQNLQGRGRLRDQGV